MDVLNCGQLGLGNGSAKGKKVRRLHRARIMTVNHEVGRGPLWRRFRLRFIAHRLREFRHIIQEHAQRNPGFSQSVPLWARAKHAFRSQRLCISLQSN